MPDALLKKYQGTEEILGIELRICQNLEAQGLKEKALTACLCAHCALQAAGKSLVFFAHFARKARAEFIEELAGVLEF